MNCRQKSSSNDGDIINISSMLDVMFILIIFFLVTTTFKEEEIDHMVNLPVDAKNQSLTQSSGNLIKINIRKSGAYVLMGKQVTEEQISEWKNLNRNIINKLPSNHMKSPEYAADIINSVSSGNPCTIYGNVINNGYIDGLPSNSAVEVPCKIDRSGIFPQKVVHFPPHLMALIRTNINVQELTVHSLINQDKESIYHAAMLDPHTGAELDLDQIKNLVDELILEHGEWMPSWLQ